MAGPAARAGARELPGGVRGARPAGPAPWGAWAAPGDRRQQSVARRQTLQTPG